jgi:hypothetical protein
VVTLSESRLTSDEIPDDVPDNRTADDFTKQFADPTADRLLPPANSMNMDLDGGNIDLDSMPTTNPDRQMMMTSSSHQDLLVPQEGDPLLPGVAVDGLNERVDIVRAFRAANPPDESGKFADLLKAVLEPAPHHLVLDQREASTRAHVDKLRAAITRKEDLNERSRRGDDLKLQNLRDQLARTEDTVEAKMERLRAPSKVYVAKELLTLVSGLSATEPVRTGFFVGISATGLIKDTGPHSKGSGIGALTWLDRPAASVELAQSLLEKNAHAAFLRVCAFGSVNVELNNHDAELVHRHHMQQMVLFRHWLEKFRPTVLNNMETHGFEDKAPITMDEETRALLVGYFKAEFKKTEAGRQRLLEYGEMARKSGGDPDKALHYLAMHLGSKLAGALHNKDFPFPRVLFAGSSDERFMAEQFGLMETFFAEREYPFAGVAVAGHFHERTPAYNHARQGEPTIAEAVLGDITNKKWKKAMAHPEMRWLAGVVAMKMGLTEQQIVHGDGLKLGGVALREFFRAHALQEDMRNIE